LPRHDHGIPPHKINHKRNNNSLKRRGIKEVIGVFSVGSLRLKIKPGSLVVPHDYINFGVILTFSEKEVKHTIPDFYDNSRERIIKAAGENKIKVIKKGVYFQARGPRFETKAEINLIKHYADIVGMTLASEATLASEIGLNYAAICLVDNYAAGISEEKLTITKWKKGQIGNKEKVLNLLKAL